MADRMVTTHVTIPAPHHQALLAIATHRDRPIAYIIREAIAAYLKEQAK